MENQVSNVNKNLNADCKAKPVVMHLIDTTGPGGAETVFVQLADLMREQGYQSLVVIRGAGWVEDELRRRGLSPIIIDAKGSFNVKFLLSLRALIRKHKVSLIHSHLLGSNVYAAIAGLISHVPVVATYHGMVDVSPDERFRFIKHQAMRFGIKSYVAVSQSLMANIQAQGLLNINKTSVIYNGIDTAKYGISTEKSIRVALNLSDDAVLIGSLGNIRPAKAYDVLVKAAALLVAKNPQLHFVIAGHQKASLMAELTALIAELGVEGNIHFLGFQQDCAGFLSQMNMFLLSSKSEGFSISTIEAMATGLPVLVTRCGGPEEIVTHDVNGWLVEPENPTAIAEGLEVLLADEALKSRLAIAGQNHARECFGVEQMLNSYSTIYQSVMK
jgi:glycosyltransferase involved in cell wall biosynthesis